MAFIISIFRGRGLVSIKNKLVSLYLLNILDIIFTLLLTRTGMVVEANFIMAQIMNSNIALSLTLKIVLPLIVCMWIYFRLKTASDKMVLLANILITCLVTFYSLVNIVHIVSCIFLLIS